MQDRAHNTVQIGSDNYNSRDRSGENYNPHIHNF